MTEQKTHQSMLSISELLRRTFHLLENHFFEFLFAVTIPFFVAYLALWIGSSVFVTDFNAIQTFDDLKQLFSFEQRTAGVALLSFVIVAFANIIGLIAAPLVAVEHESITIRQIFSHSLRYFGSYLAYLILFGVALLLALILAHVVLFVIDVALALISTDLLDSVNVTLENWLDAFFLTLTSLFLIFAPFFLIEKRLGAWQSIKHSVQMVAGHFWGILIRVALGLICVTVIVFILQYIPIVGSPLAFMVGTLILVPYQYFIYKDVTA